ncbi:MAG: right-handed parallel beta-helix repeat-containing protein [Planctomycetota bacterium]
MNFLALLGVLLLVASVIAAPGRVYVVDQAHPDADDAGPGDSARPLRTISAAARLAEAGDTVRVHAGVYRERVAPARGGTADAPVVYEAAPGSRPIITALDVWQPDWAPTDLGPNILRGRLDTALFELNDPQLDAFADRPTSFNPFTLPLSSAPSGGRVAVDPFGEERVEADPTQLPQTRGQVFLDGQPLTQVTTEQELRRIVGTWRVVAGGLEVHFPPGRTEGVIEISVRSRCFAPYRRGLGHIHVRGFEMVGGASDFPRGFYKAGKSPQCGVLGTRSGHHWLIEHNVIRHGKSLGLDIGAEGKEDADGLGQPPVADDATGRHVVRHNTISDNGCGGIAGIRSWGSHIHDNIVERNNRLGFTAPEIGGIKLHFFGDGILERNLVRDNHCYGIWLDNMYHRARVSRNLIVGNQGAGLFVELGRGPLVVDHNVIALTRPLANHTGDGVYSHDASGVTFVNNLVMFNAGFGLWAHVATDRQPRLYTDGQPGERSPADASNWTVANNLFIGNSAGALALPPDDERSTGNVVDHNLYAGTYPRLTMETFAATLDPATFRLVSNKGRTDVPAADLTLDAWQEATGHDADSRFLRVLRPQLAPATGRLTLILGDAAHTPGQRFDLPGGDYFGHVTDTPYIGPFANVPTEPLLDVPGPYGEVGSDHEFNVLLWPVVSP